MVGAGGWVNVGGNGWLAGGIAGRQEGRRERVTAGGRDGLGGT